ncbi:hypothetical protein BASA81_006916 [Batrachochytrium salamandrivorans]|nr:hypothetical protein BASA81_006916 [Batrachochytrium salamandrivorans]
MADTILNLLRAQVRNALSSFVELGDEINFGLGAIVLENAVLKVAALTDGMQFDLPVKLVSGSLAKIVVNLGFFSGTYKVELTGLVLEAELNDLSDLPDPEVLAAYVEAALKCQADGIWAELDRVLKSLPAMGPLLGDDDDKTYVGSTIAQIKNNIRITVIGVEFKIYKTRDRDGDFVLCSLGSLDLFTCDTDFVTEFFDKNGDRVIRKVCLIRDLAMATRHEQVLEPTNIDALVTLDANPMHPTDHLFAKDIRLLFLGSVNLSLSVSQTKSLLAMSNIVSRFGIAMERMRSAYLRGKELDPSALAQDVSDYSAVAQTRLESKNLLAPFDAKGLALEAKLSPAKLRQVLVELATKHHQRRQPAKTPPLAGFDPDPAFPALFPQLSKFPLIDEYDLVFTDRVEAKALGEDGSIAFDKADKTFPGLLDGSVVVGVNGYSLRELPSSESKLLVLSKAKFPLTVRLACVNPLVLPSSSMALRVMLPNVCLEMTDASRTGTVSTKLCVFGIEFGTESALYRSSMSLSVLGLEGPWAFGGMGKKNAAPLAEGGEGGGFSFSPFERTALLTAPNAERWKLVNARPWRNASTKPLVSNLQISTVFDVMRVSGAIGTLGVCVNPAFADLMQWQQQALAVAPMPADQVPVLLPAPPIAKVHMYVVNLQAQALQVHFESKGEGGEPLVMGIEQVKIVPVAPAAPDEEPGSVARIATSFQLVLSPDVAQISVPKLDVVMVGEDHIGISLCVMPKVVTVSKESLRLLLAAQASLAEALAVPESVLEFQRRLAESALPLPTVGLLSQEQNDPDEGKRLHDNCRLALVDATRVAALHEPFSLSLLEATDLYASLKQRVGADKMEKLPVHLGLLCHSLDELVGQVVNPPSIKQPRMQVGVLVADLRLKMFSQWEFRFRDLILGAETNSNFLGDLSCTVEISNLRFEEIKPGQARNYKIVHLGKALCSYRSPASSGVKLELRPESNVRLVSMGSTKVKPPTFLPIANQFFGTGRGEVVDLLELRPDEAHVRLECFQIRITMLVANLLMETMNQVTAIMGEAPAPLVPAPPPPPPVTATAARTVVTFSLFGADMAFEDLAQSAPQKNVTLSFGDESKADMFSSNEYAVSLFLCQQQSGMRLVARIQRLGLMLIVSEFTNDIEHTRLRTILNPMGMSLVYKQQTNAAGVLESSVELELTKPMSFSLWAEEVATFQAVMDAMNRVPPTATPPLERTPTPPPTQPPPTNAAAAAAAARSKSQPAGVLSSSQLVTRPSSERRVTFEDKHDSRSSADASFYTAEEMDSDVGGGGGAGEQVFTVQVKCTAGIALEVVKRSLGRISSGSFLPVLLFSAKPLTLTMRTQSMGARDLAMNCFFSSEAQIHNANLGVWEPLIERFDVEVRARKAHASHFEFALWISSRININISETDTRILSKLTEDFSTTNKGKGSTGLKRNIVLQNFSPNDYGISNGTGSDIEVVQLYQVGCSLPGTLVVAVRDAWALPQRTRWQKTPTIVGRVLPWSDVTVINHQVLAKDEIWSTRPLTFSFRYPGTSGDFPSLELVVIGDDGEELTTSVALAPHIVVPNKDGMSEWIQLFGKRGVHSEMLLKISYEYDNAAVASVPPQSAALAATKQVISSGDVEPICFEGVPPNIWVSDLNRSQFLKKGTQNTMRLAKLSFDLEADRASTANLEVDESNAYMMKLGKAEVFIKSAVRPGGKRMIQIESPLLVVNDSFANLEIIICSAVTPSHCAAATPPNGEGDGRSREDFVLVPLEWAVLRDDSQRLVFQAIPSASKPAVAAADNSSLASSEGARMVFPNLLKFNPLTSDLPQNWTLRGLSVTTQSWMVLCERDECYTMTFPIPEMGHFSKFQLDFPSVGDETRKSPGEFKGLELVGLSSVELFEPSLSPVVTWICSTCDEVNADETCLLCGQPARPMREITEASIAASAEDCLLLFDRKSIPVRLKRSPGSKSTELQIISVPLNAMLKRVQWSNLTRLEFDDESQQVSFLFAAEPQLNFQLKFSSSNLELTYFDWKQKFQKDFGEAKSSLLKKGKKVVRRLGAKKASVLRVGTVPLFAAQANAVFARVLGPGMGFAIPLRFLLPMEEPLQIYLHPVDSPSCSLLIEDLANYKDALFSRTWLRCKQPQVQVNSPTTGSGQSSPDLVFSAHVQSRFIPYKIEESTATVDTRNNRVKFRIVPWLIVQNALPYTMTFRFFLGLTPREEIYKLLPGKERGFFDVDEHALVQFRLEDFNSNYTEWSSPLLPYREDSSGFSTAAAATGRDSPQQQRRFPKRRDYFSIPHIKEGNRPLPLVLERSNDAKTSLRCVVYATCWMYNYSDLGVSFKMGKGLLSTGTAALTANANGKSSDSFLFPPKLTLENCSVQPGLVTLPMGENDLTFGRMCGVLGWDEENLKLVMDRFSAERPIQPMAIVETASLIQKQQQQQQQDVVAKKLLFSRPKFNFKLTTAVYPCEFVFSNREVRFVSIEVSRPDAPPFNRSLQIIIRPRYMLQNLLAMGQTIFFREGKAPATTAALEVGLLANRRKHIAGESERHIMEHCGDSDGEEDEEGQVLLMPRDEQAHGLKEIQLKAGGLAVPFHFSALRSAHSFTVAVIDEAVDPELHPNRWRTHHSGQMVLDHTKEEALYCVALRSFEDGLAMGGNSSRIRVLLKPHSNGSVVVKFDEDTPQAMFKIDNRSRYAIEVKQTKTSSALHNMVVLPSVNLAVGFDEPMKPTFVSMRVLARKDEVPVRRKRTWFGFGASEEIHHAGLEWVPVSTWQIYPMETVSERDPLRLDKYHVDNEQLAVEGVVDGSSLVLRITAEDSTSMLYGKSTSCLLAVRVISGQNLSTCKSWAGSSSSGSFHPYVVVSVGGKTKQTATQTKGDTNNPNWDEGGGADAKKQKRGLMFELSEVPQVISCTLLNENPDIRDVLAVARIPVPKSFFIHHLLGQRPRNNSRDLFFDTEEEDEAGEEGGELGLHHYTTAADAEGTGVHGEEGEDEDGWVEVDSELWKSWKLHDRAAHREEVLQDGLSLNSKHKPQMSGPNSALPETRSLLRRQSRMRSLRAINNGEVFLRRIFAKPEDEAAAGADGDANSNGEDMTKKTAPRLRIAVKIVRLPTNALAFVNGYETKLRLEMNSLGVSLMNVAKTREIAYVCMQRAKMRLVQTTGVLYFESSLGNFQVDNLVSDNSQYPIAIHPAVAQNFIEVNLFMLQSHPTVRFLETCRVSIQQLNVSLEERFLSEVAGVFARGLVDQSEAVAGFTAQGEAASSFTPATVVGLVPFSDEPVAIDAVSQTTTSEKMHLMYFDTFEICPLRVKINLDLEGGRNIDDMEEDAVASAIRGMIPIITLDVRDLFLRISGMQRTGWFVAQTTWKGTVLRHYVRQILLNSGKVLASTNWAGNPIQAGRNVVSGFYFLVTEPVRGANEDKFMVVGFCSGLSSGVTAFFAGVATGLSETVHGVSNAVVNSYHMFHVAMEYDVTTRPMASMMELLRDVSGALATSAREIKEEVIQAEKDSLTHVRSKRREFGENGMVIAFGPGNIPVKELRVLERQAAKRILRWYARTKLQHSQREADDFISEHFLLGQQRMREEQLLQEQPGGWCACCSPVSNCFVQFANEIDEVRKSQRRV